MCGPKGPIAFGARRSVRFLRVLVLNLTTSVYDYEDFASTSYIKDVNSEFVDEDLDNLTDEISTKEEEIKG